jgi:uncharacterized protein YhfF
MPRNQVRYGKEESQSNIEGGREMIGSDAPEIKEYWEVACREKGIDPSSKYHALTFGDPTFFSEIDEITELACAGQKRATSHLQIDFEISDVPMRDEGDYWLLLDVALKPRGLVQLSKVETKPFNEVDEEYAAIEGEGDSSLNHWTTIHRDYFQKQLEVWGRDWREDLPVVCEIFKLVHAAPSPKE